MKLPIRTEIKETESEWLIFCFFDSDVEELGVVVNKNLPDAEKLIFAIDFGLNTKISRLRQKNMMRHTKPQIFN